MSKTLYTKLEASFWTDKEIQQFDRAQRGARELYAYYITGPHRNAAGLYYLPDHYAAGDLNIDIGEYRRLKDYLTAQGRIAFDERTDFILITKFLKHNPLEGPNQVKGAITILETVPDTPLLAALLPLVQRYLGTDPTPLTDYLTRRVTAAGILQQSLFEVAAAIEPANIPAPPPPPPPGPSGPTKKDAEALIAAYNQICHDGAAMAKATVVSDERVEKVKRLLKKFKREDVTRAFSLAAESDWLAGRPDEEGKTWGRCDFDWIINPTNLTKILEGRYKNKPKGLNSPRGGKAMAGLAAMIQGGQQ